MTQMPLITACNLTKSFGSTTVLDGVSMDIRSGECVALVGPNGAGKSTLIKIALGIIPATDGAIKVLHVSPRDSGFEAVKRRIGFLPEQVQFHGALSGRDTLRFYADLKGVPRGSIENLLVRVRLSDAASRAVSTYSKGMRQRLGLAQALLGTPEVLLLDEPMTGLDPEARSNFFQILDEEKARGAAIILSSHILTGLEARTDRVAVLSRSRLQAIGSIAELRADLGLGSQIRVYANPAQMQRISKRFAPRFGPERFINGVAVLECGDDGKLALLKELMTGDADFENVDIIEPNLEDVFAAYTAGDGLK